MRKIIFIIQYINILLFTTRFSVAQDIQWNTAPQKGFVFEISNDEAQRLLTRHNSDKIFNDLLHTLTDTFDVQKGWTNRPSKGHFILTKIVENKLHCEYTCVFPYQVFLFKEYDALALQVLDLDGNVREDAVVKFRLGKIGFDQESKTYRIENQWFYGDDRIVTVELNGFRSFFNISKHKVPFWDNYFNYDDGPAFYSYMITDKNKYKPNEYVRFKSYALSHYRFPLRKELEIWLSGYNKTFKAGQVSPHRPGSYTGEFQLRDSLNLMLDKPYWLQLREKNGCVVASCSFRYEDYELSGNKLTIELAQNEQFYPENNQLTITATDVNGLFLKDAKASILVKTLSIRETFQPLVILSDTLFFKEINLNPEKPTTFDIFPELFQKTNTSYQVIVTVINSQNQRMQQIVSALYYYSQYELISRFSNDSICFNLLSNGVPMKNVSMELHYDDEPQGREVQLPYKEKLNPAAKSFHFKNDLISRQIIMSHLSPDLKLIGGIQKDSFNIKLHNPQQLEISWYVYQGSQLLEKGFGREWDYKSLINDRTQTYYVELQYVFGGQEQRKCRQYVFKESFLNVSLDIPERVYPGQEVDASISVTNQLGKPVRGVDLTALAVTGKLNYYLPDLPYYGTSSSPRPKSDHYSKRNLNEQSAVLELDYHKWRDLARLDTMIYYQFIYPGSKPFRYSYNIDDSTQFAPYVMRRGRAMNVYVIEVNKHPVYYSWTNRPGEYSFYVMPGVKKEISLRLCDTVIVLDSIMFETGKKTILSIDIDNLPEKTKVFKLKQRFTSVEVSRYRKYISAFENISNGYSFLESEDEFTPLADLCHPIRYNELITAGPIKPGKKNYADNNGYKITYRHTGGYRYSFEDNIVYKQDYRFFHTFYLKDETYDPMKNINDLVMTKDHFLRLQKEKQNERYLWHTRTIDIVEPGSRIKIFLPHEKRASGIATLLLEDCEMKTVISPCFANYYRNQTDFYKLPTGYHNAIVLYNNGTYLKMDSIYLKPYINVVIDLNNSVLHPKDSRSVFWLLHWAFSESSCYKVSPDKPSYDPVTYRRHSSTGNITGTVYDENNEPLVGATIIVKGTQSGTIADLDGHFALQIDDYTATIIISYIGYITEEIEVIRGSDVIVRLTEDLTELSEVVVVGYGTTSRSDLTGAISSVNAQAMSVPDDEAENVVDNHDEVAIQEAEKQLYRELLNLNSIRSNFSDVGFWEPRLFTDKLGEAHFKVTFPDDITRWDAVVYAMNRNLQTGTERKFIRSYKPLMAELHVPQFLTRGDSSLFLGKVLNYTSDSLIQGKVQWSGTETNFEKDIRFTSFHTDKLPVSVTSIDSITTRYVFTRDDGYMDGEERTVPVVEQGIIRADGTLSILQNNENKYLKASDNEKMIVEILDNQLDIYGSEVRYLVNYRYACNEQLASKLIGLVNHKLLMQYEGKKFKYDHHVNRIIRRLLKNQNQEFLWSWWDVSSNTSYWMSAHILRALKCAKDAGYNVDLNIENIVSKATYKFDFLHQYSVYDVDLLHALSEWGANLDYTTYIGILDSIILKSEHPVYTSRGRYYYRYSYLKEKFLLQGIRQMNNLSFQRDSLLKYKKEGIMGEIFFSDDKKSYYWYNNTMAANVVAYRIIKRDSVLNHMQVPMQMYFLSSRSKGSWNTYQSSNVIMNVLPDLLNAGYSKEHTATVKLRGKVDTTITDFPYRVMLQPGEEINVQKESGLPLFLMQYSEERVTKAKTGIEGFKIKTYFSHQSNELRAGVPVDLIVEVKVKKDADFEHVMIEVPIPGACSYEDKHQSYYGIESHREYFKERTVIFCQRMKTGNYRFVIHLLPRFTGKYIMNPAQVSLMYVPVVNANTDIKQVKVYDHE